MSSNGNGSAPRAEALNASRIAVGLTAGDLQKSLRFYTEGLGFAIESKTEAEGRVVFAMLKAGNGQIGLGQDDFAKGHDRKKGIGMRLWIVTDQSVEAIANRMKAAGFKLDTEPAPLPWGPMSFEVTDPSGFLISVRSET